MIARTAEYEKYHHWLKHEKTGDDILDSLGITNTIISVVLGDKEVKDITLEDFEKLIEYKKNKSWDGE